LRGYRAHRAVPPPWPGHHSPSQPK
jgi:hypothetical protein